MSEGNTSSNRLYVRQNKSDDIRYRRVEGRPMPFSPQHWLADKTVCQACHRIEAVHSPYERTRSHLRVRIRTPRRTLGEKIAGRPHGPVPSKLPSTPVDATQSFPDVLAAFPCRHGHLGQLKETRRTFRAAVTSSATSIIVAMNVGPLFPPNSKEPRSRNRMSSFKLGKNTA